MADNDENEYPPLIPWKLRDLLWLLPLVIAFVWMVWTARTFSGLQTIWGLETAQLARNLANDEGFTTSVIRPLSVQLTGGTGIPHPDLMNAPFMPVLTSLFFRVGGAGDRMAVAASGVGWIVCSLLVYLLARDVFDSRRTGLAALFIWMLNLMALQYSTAGSGLTWAMAMVTALFWLIHKTETLRIETRLNNWRQEDPVHTLPLKWVLAMGLICGLLSLTIPFLKWVMLIPLVVYWSVWERRCHLPPWDNTTIDRGFFFSPDFLRNYRLRLLCALFLPVILLYAPWWLRHLSLTGSAGSMLGDYVAMTFSTDFPGESIFRLAAARPPDPAVFLLTHPFTVMMTSLRALLPLPLVLAKMCGGLLLLLCLLSFFHPAAVRIRILRRMLAGMFVLAVAILSVWSRDAAVFMVFTPVATVLATGELQRRLSGVLQARPESPVRKRYDSMLVRQLRFISWHLWRPWIYGLAGCLLLIQPLNVWLALGPKRPVKISEGMAFMMDQAGPNDLVLTDSPWSVAWYGNLTSMLLPQREDDYDYLAARGFDCTWIYLTGAALKTPAEESRWWSELVKHPEGWRDYQPVPGRRFIERVLRRTEN